VNKKLITIIIVFKVLTTCLFAQPDFTFSGGLNLGRLIYDSGNSLGNTSIRPGLLFGIEILRAPFIIGAAYVRRGGSLEINSIDYKESFSLDYITGYALFYIPIVKDLSGLFGCQIGECMGGTFEYVHDGDTGSAIIYTDSFNTEFGLLLGTDYMFHPRIGARISYYAGLNNMLTGYNIKNSGFGIFLLLKL